MKNWVIYVGLNLVEGLANIAATIFSALIVIALYKTTKSMQVDDLLDALYILESTSTVVTMFFVLLLAVCVRAVCEKLKRKFEK